jgi:hypothetical protein
MATKTKKTTLPKVAGEVPSFVRALAARDYDATIGDATFALPGGAKRRISEATGLPVSRLASLVDPVYFEKNGRRNPIALPKTRNERTLATAVRKRRDAGTTLGRWESVAAALSETLGRPVSEAAVRALYEKGGGDLDSSYVGRGTRVGAPATRESEIAEVTP